MSGAWAWAAATLPRRRKQWLMVILACVLASMSTKNRQLLLATYRGYAGRAFAAPSHDERHSTLSHHHHHNTTSIHGHLYKNHPHSNLNTTTNRPTTSPTVLSPTATNQSPSTTTRPTRSPSVRSPPATMSPHSRDDDNNNINSSDVTIHPTDAPSPPPPPRDHPHAGARDASGAWEFVADVTTVRRYMLQQQRLRHDGQDELSMPSLTFLPLQNVTTTNPNEPNEFDHVCHTPPGKGYESVLGWDLMQKVRVDIPNPVNETVVSSSLFEGNNTTADPTTTTHDFPVPPTRHILCAVYTYGKVHHRLPGIVQTWGWRCDGFFAASTLTQLEDPLDEGFGAVDLPHLGEETYRNMWQKTRSILGYMYDHYVNDYDYFYLCGDDTHLIVENLRRYLGSLETRYDVETIPLYIGQNIKYPSITFQLGGPGYVLNRVALKRLVEEGLPSCFTHTIVAAEDRFVGLCFAKLGIRPLDTADDRGQQRFHGSDPAFIARYKGDHGYFKDQYEFWAQNHGWKIGRDLISEQSIAFHWLKTAAAMKRHHVILYRGSCPSGSILGDVQWQQEQK